MRGVTFCHPCPQCLVDQLIEEYGRQGLSIKIGETFRTVTRQDALFVQGRTKPGNIATNAPGSNYSSYHWWGTASDICRNGGAGVYNDSVLFFQWVGAIGMSLGLEWGGNWRSVMDNPHFQLPDQGSSTSGIKKVYATPEAFMETWIPEECTGWIEDNNGWRYHRSDGSYPANAWHIISHHRYFFDKDGYTCTNWHHWNDSVCDPEDGSGDWYYFDSTADGPLGGACQHSRNNGAQGTWFVDTADTI